MKATISPEPALLGFLQEGPLHGYDLHRQLTAQLGPLWHLGMSQMYAVLKDYKARGWIKTVVEPQAGRPARQMLRLTPQGKRAFDAWMAQTARGLREFRVDFFARLYFARAAGRPALRAFLAQQITATRRECETLARATDTVEFADTVRSFRLAQLRAILEWLEAYAAQNAAPVRTPRALRTRPRRAGARKR